MTMQMLSDHVRPLTDTERFCFRCHRGVSCFTECCRELELALTPYDVLRLKNRLHIDSADFLARYAIIEQPEGGTFPRVYLAMVDDGRASCPFVTDTGCTVYEDRPAACRTYPLGRGAAQQADGSITIIHMLLTEPHCQGFRESQEQDVAAWVADQELASYNRMNDLLPAITQHSRIKNGMRLSFAQRSRYLTALYDLDTFRNQLPGNMPHHREVETDDQALLLYALQWLRHELYEE